VTFRNFTVLRTPQHDKTFAASSTVALPEPLSFAPGAVPEDGRSSRWATMM
jgi:hypothetical protein